MPHAEVHRDTFAHLRRTVTRVEHVVQLAEQATVIPNPNRNLQLAALLVVQAINKRYDLLSPVGRCVHRGFLKDISKR